VKRYCKCVGWSEKYQCRDGIDWDTSSDNEPYQKYPPGERCRCADDCCWDHCQCAVQEVPPVGTYLVVDGVVKRVVETERLERIENTTGWTVWTEDE
jgi:hypothetical protein